ncbi:MAG: MBL fold metallo-hydrolase, partial [Gemmatimonadales bacterium]
MSSTRREWLRTMGALGAGPLIPRELWQQAPQSPADRLAAFRAGFGSIPIKAEPLSENLTLLSGPGGNVVVLRDKDALILVDTFAAPAWPKLEETLKTFGGRVKIVINTHWHLDHTDNNPQLRALGATVVACENTRRRMTEPHHLAVLEVDVPPSPIGALPQRV